jgi:hypothetical protein
MIAFTASVGLDLGRRPSAWKVLRIERDVGHAADVAGAAGPDEDREVQPLLPVQLLRLDRRTARLCHSR